MLLQTSVMASPPKNIRVFFSSAVSPRPQTLLRLYWIVQKVYVVCVCV